MLSSKRLASSVKALSTVAVTSGRGKVNALVRRPYNHGRRVQSTTPAAASPKATEESHGVVDFLSDHGGKVALVALSVAGGLIYTYFLSIQEKSNTETAVEQHALIEPYEILQLRYANNPLPAVSNGEDGDGSNDESSSGWSEKHQGVSFDDFAFLLQHFRELLVAERLPLTWSYRSFVQRVEAALLQRHAEAEGVSPHGQQRDDVIVVKDSSGQSFSIPRLQQKDATANAQELSAQRRRSFQLIFGSLLDRMVYHKVCVEVNKRSKELGSNLEEAGVFASRGQKPAYYEVDDVLTLDWFLSLLLLVLPTGHHYGRCHATWQLLAASKAMQTEARQEVELSGRNAIAGFHEEHDDASSHTNTNSSNTVKEVSRDDVLYAISLLQGTDQIPAEKQVMETGVKYPVRLYKQRQPTDILEMYEKNSLKLPESSPSKKDAYKQVWSEEDFHKLLQSAQVCAWGICYKPVE